MCTCYIPGQFSRRFPDARFFELVTWSPCFVVKHIHDFRHVRGRPCRHLATFGTPGCVPSGFACPQLGLDLLALRSVRRFAPPNSPSTFASGVAVHFRFWPCRRLSLQASRSTAFSVASPLALGRSSRVDTVASGSLSLRALTSRAGFPAFAFFPSCVVHPPGISALLQCL